MLTEGATRTRLRYFMQSEQIVGLGRRNLRSARSHVRHQIRFIRVLVSRVITREASCRMGAHEGCSGDSAFASYRSGTLQE